MNRRCDKSCVIRRSGNKLSFICPYGIDVFGIELNSGCLERLREVASRSDFMLTIDNGVYSKTYEDISRVLNVKRLKGELELHRKMGYSDHEALEWVLLPEGDFSSHVKLIALGRVKHKVAMQQGSAFISVMPSGKCIYVVESVAKPSEFTSSDEEILWRVAGNDRNFEKFLLLLYDEEVQEIYVDREDSFAYLDHDLFGRCETNVLFTHVEIEKLETALSLMGWGETSYMRPSLKADVRASSFHLRVSIDTPPLTESVSIDIRRLRGRFMSLYRLVELGALNPESAAFLVFMARHRMNIVICGEPDSGKTTLANAIDLELPKSWRRIYVEDVSESVAINDGKQVKIKVPTIEVDPNSELKGIEIIKLLHRSPDWIYLGEIQSEAQVKAMFEAFASGLKGIATIHADSYTGLLKRLHERYGVGWESIGLIDVIVCMGREIDENGRIRRYLRGIYVRGAGEGYALFEPFQVHRNGRLFKVKRAEDTLPFASISNRYYGSFEDTLREYGLMVDKYGGVVDLKAKDAQ